MGTTGAAWRTCFWLRAMLASAGRARPGVPRADPSPGSAALPAAPRESPSASHKVWVYFRDKGPDPAARLDATALSARARARRALRGSTRGVTFEDLPLVPSYVAQVTAGVTRVRQRVAWLNAMSVEASAEEVAS